MAFLERPPSNSPVSIEPVSQCYPFRTITGELTAIQSEGEEGRKEEFHSMVRRRGEKRGLQREKKKNKREEVKPCPWRRLFVFVFPSLTMSFVSQSQ